MNYKIEAIDILLNEDCIIARYYPLIPYKKELLEDLKNRGISTRDACLNSFEQLHLVRIFNDQNLVVLFRRFLSMYEMNQLKQKELKKLDLPEDEKKVFEILYNLPGVKEVRARLYYLAGYRSFKDIANSSLEEILEKLEKTIKENNLDVILPLPKEVKTHIAVSKAFNTLVKDKKAK